MNREPALEPVRALGLEPVQALGLELEPVRALVLGRERERGPGPVPEPVRAGL